MSADAPAANDYVQALQNPKRVFSTPVLQQAAFVEDSMGMPMAVRGASAAVFQARVEGMDCALRCFLRIGASSEHRNDLVGRYLAQSGVANVVRPDWLDNEVKVKGTYWPVLRMEWVDGELLSEYVGRLVTTGDYAGLQELAGKWLSLMNDLEARSIGHGDLQHGNVLVDRRSGQLRLIDLDGAWVPSVSGMAPPHELGHPNYSHPLRSQAHWGQHMDTFSALVIYLSIVALASDRYLSIDSNTGPRGLWSDFHSGENLLFKKEDFELVGRTPIWTRLAYLDNRWVGQLLRVLESYCAPGFASNVAFSQALRDAAGVFPWMPPPAVQSAPRQSVVVDNSGTVWGTQGQERVLVSEPPRQFSQPVPPATQTRKVGWWFAISVIIAIAELAAFGSAKSNSNGATLFLVAFCLTLVAVVIMLIWLISATNRARAAAVANAPPAMMGPPMTAPPVGPPPMTSSPGSPPPLNTGPQPGVPNWRQ
jgi:hypothetical protein